MSYIKKQAGITPKYNHSQIKDMLLDGKDYSEISSSLNCPKRVVRYVRFKYKINVNKNVYKKLRNVIE
jgi:hypothetical protein